MNLEASAPTTTLSAGFSALKAAVGLTAGLLLCILIVLRDLPFFRFPTLLLFIASACFILVRGRRPPDLLHPVRVFGALWCLWLALASIRCVYSLSACHSLPVA